MGDPGVDLRLVVPHPQHLGGGETGHDIVASDLDEAAPADPVPDIVGLGMGSLIVPQDRRPQHLTGVIEQDETVHLPGHPDPADVAAIDAGFGQRLLDCLYGRLPPQIGSLLRPQRPRCLVVVL